MFQKDTSLPFKVTLMPYPPGFMAGYFRVDKFANTKTSARICVNANDFSHTVPIFEVIHFFAVSKFMKIPGHGTGVTR